MYWLDGIVPPLETRGPLTLQSFTSDLLPFILSHYVAAFLMLLPNTFALRIALLPISLWLGFRASIRLDLSIAYEGATHMNNTFMLFTTAISMRLITWAFRRAPFTRLKERLAGKKPSILTLMGDAFDLTCNFRGVGWCWSTDTGFQAPVETRPTTSKIAFLAAVCLSFVKLYISFDLLHYALQSFAPLTLGSPSGGTIYNPELHPILYYLQSSIIALLGGTGIYCAIAIIYDGCTIIALVIFRQEPADWPPIFNAPFNATSINEFWSQGWHQLFRDIFIFFGAKPMSAFGGRLGGVIGAFLASGILHDCAVWGLGNGGECQSFDLFFVMMGVGIIMEVAWMKVTGRKVEGTVGRIWTFMWIIGIGNILADAWGRKGLLGSTFQPTRLRPTTHLFGALRP